MKINVNLNRIPESYKIKDDFEKARLYFLKHGVTLDFTFSNTDVKGYISTYDTGLNRWLINVYSQATKDPTADINMFVFDQAEWANFTNSEFPLLPNTPNGLCFFVNGKPFVEIGRYKTPDAIQIQHELMHALIQMSNFKKFPVQDKMDSYFLNSTPDAPNGNFAQMWVLLAPFIASQTSHDAPRATLTRNSDNGTQTQGTLVINDFRCFTLERPWKNNLSNISCVPKGIYQCKYTFSYKFLKYTYELQKTSPRSGIRIHSGNFFFDIAGCILLGDSYSDINHDGKVDILNSRITIAKFENKMQRLPFMLVIR
jgi:hypothetical protein